MRHVQLIRSALLGAVSAAILLATPAPAAAPEDEIAGLLDRIAASPCVFIRNGVSYDGAAAVAHIRDKYRYYRAEIASAEEFIDRAASRSELTGRPYLVRCGATTEPAAAWLRHELQALRSRP